jgi:hypothetical protein
MRPLRSRIVVHQISRYNPAAFSVSAHHVLVPSKILTMHFGAQTVIGAGGDLILYKPYYGQQYIAEYFTSII